jgi:hypothetical protein
MSIVQLLMDTAVEDSRLLVKNQEMGDRSEIPRDIDFVLWAKDEAKARLVADFVGSLAKQGTWYLSTWLPAG